MRFPFAVRRSPFALAFFMVCSSIKRFAQQLSAPYDFVKEAFEQFQPFSLMDSISTHSR
jgi:hypothetical protein